MDVTTPTQTTQTSVPQAVETESTAAVLASDFETFLQMLTAQARYQDPLEPIDSSQYASQLAQFSMVEQQVQSNDLLNLLSGQISASNIGQIAGWIGMEARTTAAVSFDGSPITVAPEIETGADEAFIVAYNSDGAEVDRKTIPLDSEVVEWVGIDSTGSAFPSGLYTFKVESRSAGQELGVTAAETYAKITEARRDGTNTVFVLDGGSVVTADDVSALREAA
ncbi:flagellar hook capping FlgD N-terminal domain-containing protein [Roseobacter sp.]|uniref:flagellar hook capping FlgD N-terminal domain-containing protein n=1 Tax=Roseobacter sp. TaxID=1907202 RepID=UPI0032999569